MRAVIQRVSSAKVSWSEQSGSGESAIGPGLLVLLGVCAEDQLADADRLARKVTALRIFPDVGGRTNLSLGEINGDVLVISQFTLLADISRGRRPSFIGAGDPDRAAALYDDFAAALTASGVRTATGRFGAEMSVSLVNQGPFTLVLSTEDWPTRI